MPDELPSLEILLPLALAERAKQLEHLDALDDKAGIVLGFSGLLVTLIPDTLAIFRFGAVVSAMVAATLALWSFWPRGYGSLQPSALRSYLHVDGTVTQLKVLDTVTSITNSGARALEAKARRLVVAMWALLAAALTLAVSTLI